MKILFFLAVFAGLIFWSLREKQSVAMKDFHRVEFGQDQERQEPHLTPFASLPIDLEPPSDGS